MIVANMAGPDFLHMLKFTSKKTKRLCALAHPVRHDLSVCQDFDRPVMNVSDKFIRSSIKNL